MGRVFPESVTKLWPIGLNFISFLPEAFKILKKNNVIWVFAAMRGQVLLVLRGMVGSRGGRRLIRSPTRLSVIRIWIALFFGILAMPPALATKGPVIWQDPATGFAIGGYDPIAYFTRGSAMEGRYGIEVTWRGAVWKFRNDGNRSAFGRDPTVYAPRFAGYDPYGLAEGRVVQGLPTLWHIHNNKLYFFQNVINKQFWTEDPDAVLARAESRWPKVARTFPWK